MYSGFKKSVKTRFETMDALISSLQQDLRKRETKHAELEKEFRENEKTVIELNTTMKILVEKISEFKVDIKEALKEIKDKLQ